MTLGLGDEVDVFDRSLGERDGPVWVVVTYGVGMKNPRGSFA